MAKDELDIEQAINEWVNWTSENLNLTPTEDEIAAKRKELERGAGIVPASQGTEEIESWSQFQEVMATNPDAVQAIDDFVKLDDKRQLLGLPFLISRFWFSLGDVSDYATMRCLLSRPILTPEGETDRVVITDGSKGIYEQLRELSLSSGRMTNLVVRHGLRVSEYTIDTDEGTKAAKTFYLT